MALFRVDFSGRGELADRQQKLAQMLSRLQKISEGMTVIVQVVYTPCLHCTRITHASIYGFVQFSPLKISCPSTQGTALHLHCIGDRVNGHGFSL